MGDVGPTLGNRGAMSPKGPPAAYATTMVNGRVGQSCATAAFINASTAKTTVGIAAPHIANHPAGSKLKR